MSPESWAESFQVIQVILPDAQDHGHYLLIVVHLPPPGVGTIGPQWGKGPVVPPLTPKMDGPIGEGCI